MKLGIKFPEVDKLTNAENASFLILLYSRKTRTKTYCWHSQWWSFLILLYSRKTRTKTYWGHSQWWSQSLSGWADSPTQRTQMRTKIRKLWGKIRIIDRNSRKNEESGTTAHPGLWGWLCPWALRHIVYTCMKKNMWGNVLFVCLFVFCKRTHNSHFAFRGLKMLIFEKKGMF